MHTLKMTIEGTTYHVHHNGDWSNTAIVNWNDATGTLQEVTLPAPLMAKCCKNAVLTTVVSKLEDLLG